MRMIPAVISCQIHAWNVMVSGDIDFVAHTRIMHDASVACASENKPSLQ